MQFASTCDEIVTVL